jgi:hypothetical protein
LGGHPLSTSAINSLVERVAHRFRNNEIFVRADSDLVFVCGGTEKGCLRDRFLEYCAKHMTDVRVFRAEDVQKVYRERAGGLEFVNIAELEDILSELSDCVVLFPESPGSFAEIGYFAKDPDIRKKMLVVNKSSMQTTDSFISIGPIELINRNSNFRPAIYLDDNSPDFSAITERISQRLHKGRRHRFDYKPYKSMSFREKMYIILQIIYLFGPIDIGRIVQICRKIFVQGKEMEILKIVSFLVSAGYINQEGWQRIFSICNLNSTFLDIVPASTFSDLRLEIADAYQREANNAPAIQSVAA